MRRRAFLTFLTGTAVWPRLVPAQQQKVPTVGILDSASGDAFAERVAAVRKGLAALDFIDGRNVSVVSARGNSESLTERAADFVSREVSVLVALGLPAALAAKKATANRPIVFETGDDPAVSGLVSAFNKPGGNATGISLLSPEMAAKRLAFLQELVPAADPIGVLLNTTNPSNRRQLTELEAAARAIRVHLRTAMATNAEEIDNAFKSFSEQRVGAVLVGSDPLFFSRRSQLIVLAVRHSIATIYPDRDFALAGGLMSYAANRTDALIQTGIYAGRILKGEKPTNLPVLVPTKFELVINLQTARTLGLTLPLTLRIAADELIE
jgi:putative tryptophan/tyrosine transport system substrate-binding protein